MLIENFRQKPRSKIFEDCGEDFTFCKSMCDIKKDAGQLKTLKKHFNNICIEDNVWLIPGYMLYLKHWIE